MNETLKINVAEMISNSTSIETSTQVNTSSQLNSEDEILGPALVWTYISLRAFQGILAIVGNLVTIIAVWKFEFLRENSACRMVAALAVADFFGAVNPFYGIIARRFISSISILNAVCYVQVISELLAGYGNCCCTLLVTVDRYIFITRPLRYFSIVTPQRALSAILITWMVIIIQIALILAFGPSLNAEITCGWGQAMTKAAFYLTLGQFVLITFCVIVPLYGIIGCTAWKLSRNDPHITNYPPETQAIHKAKLQERKMVKTIGWVLGTYLTCFIPILLYPTLINFLGYTEPFPFGILLGQRILVFFYNFQSIQNPFIYGWKNVQFRKAYQKLLFKKCRALPLDVRA